MDHLKRYLVSSGTRQSALAARLEITRGYMSELVAGQKLPSLVLAFRIERETAGMVPAIAWLGEPTASPTSNKDAA